jgi:hypothetical protein
VLRTERSDAAKRRADGKRFATNIGLVHEQGHSELWFIAMSDASSTARTFDYGVRWALRRLAVAGTAVQVVYLGRKEVALCPSDHGLLANSCSAVPS